MKTSELKLSSVYKDGIVYAAAYDDGYGTIELCNYITNTKYNIDWYVKNNENNYNNMRCVELKLNIPEETKLKQAINIYNDKLQEFNNKMLQRSLKETMNLTVRLLANEYRPNTTHNIEVKLTPFLMQTQLLESTYAESGRSESIDQVKEMFEEMLDEHIEKCVCNYFRSIGIKQYISHDHWTILESKAEQ